jgi:hypothetical protein
MKTRYDVMDAYWLFASWYHGGQGTREYAIFGRLAKIGYKPGIHVSFSVDPSGASRWGSLVSQSGGDGK